MLNRWHTLQKHWTPFELSQDRKVTVSIYDMQGQLVRQLELGMVMPGRYVSVD
jgi:hypothetical protein